MALVKECMRCGAIVPYPGRYCEHCEGIAARELEQRKREAARVYDRGRDAQYIQFYRSAAWRQLSRGVLAQRGYKCEECGGIATEVHHDPAIQTPEGWARRFDTSGLTCLCTDCHNKRHKRFS